MGGRERIAPVVAAARRSGGAASADDDDDAEGDTIHETRSHETRSRLDCADRGTEDTVDARRWASVEISSVQMHLVAPTLPPGSRLI